MSGCNTAVPCSGWVVVVVVVLTVGCAAVLWYSNYSTPHSCPFPSLQLGSRTDLPQLAAATTTSRGKPDQRQELGAHTNSPPCLPSKSACKFRVPCSQRDTDTGNVSVLLKMPLKSSAVTRCVCSNANFVRACTEPSASFSRALALSTH